MYFSTTSLITAFLASILVSAAPAPSPAAEVLYTLESRGTCGAAVARDCHVTLKARNQEYEELEATVWYGDAWTVTGVAFTDIASLYTCHLDVVRDCNADAWYTTTKDCGGNTLDQFGCSRI